MLCEYTEHGAPDAHDIPDGARKLELTFRIDWGAADLRGPHETPLTFCSFRCLADWAARQADHHDRHVLTEGV